MLICSILKFLDARYIKIKHGKNSIISSLKINIWIGWLMIYFYAEQSEIEQYWIVYSTYYMYSNFKGIFWIVSYANEQYFKQAVAEFLIM